MLLDLNTEVNLQEHASVQRVLTLTLPKPKPRRGCMMGNLHIGEAEQDIQVLEQHTRPNRVSHSRRDCERQTTSCMYLKKSLLLRNTVKLSNTKI